MKRIHIGMEVSDLDASIRFYSTLFGSPPTRIESDYAKWMLDDPRVNFSIQNRGCEGAGTVHLGIQVEAPGELDEYATRLSEAGANVVPEPGANCCYYRSDKVWVRDPDAMRWETFHTLGATTTYGEDSGLAAVPGAESGESASKCCKPA